MMSHIWVKFPMKGVQLAVQIAPVQPGPSDAIIFLKYKIPYR